MPRIEKKMTGLIASGIILLCIAGRAEAQSFYDNYLSKAIAACPGFIGGDSQLEIEVPFQAYQQGRFRYTSRCIPGLTHRSLVSVAVDEKHINGPEGPKDEEPKDQCEVPGSIIYPTSRTLGEKVSIAGANFDLFYFTDRVIGRKGQYRVQIPLHDTSASVTGYKVYAEYAGGRVLDETFSNIPDHVYTFEWDGRDASNQIVGTATKFDFTVKVLAHGKEIPIAYKNWVGGVNAENFGFGLWTPSIYHFYDVGRGRLIFGSGGSALAAYKELPGGNLMIASEDASEVYIFSPEGKHLYTKFGLTGENKYEFSYNVSGQLQSIIEPYGKVTNFTISDGRITQITAPFGQVTNLEYDASGYLARITGPNNEIFTARYTADGLMAYFAKPEGQSNSFYYDDDGLLVKDFHSSGFFQEFALNGQISDGSKVLTLSTKMGVVETFYNNNALQMHSLVENVIQSPTGRQVRSRSVGMTDAMTYPTYVVTTDKAADKRFPENAKYIKSSSTLIASRGATTSQNQTVALSDPEDPFDINNITYTSKTKNKISTRTYNGSIKEWTATSSENRVSKIRLNEYEQVVSMQGGNLLPISFEYNSDGKVSKMSQGTRTTSLGYDNFGFVSSITNAMGNKQRFENDQNGRVIRSISPDNRETKYEYDKNGNLVGLTPPGKPKHSFILNAFEALKEYLPPALGGNPARTKYTYNADNKINRISRPDGQEIKYNYGSNGTLSSIQTPLGQYAYSYNSNVDDIYAVTSPDLITSIFEYHGPIRSSLEQRSPTLNPAYFLLQFDDEQRISKSVVRTFSMESAASRAYDKDNLMIRNGWMHYERNHQEGLITKMKLDSVEVNYIYDSSYGELEGISYNFKGSRIFDLQYKRDKLGRISWESLGGFGEDIYYDKDGRFIGRKPFGEDKPLSEYRYDTNGNRIFAVDTYVNIKEAEYDSQDRLLTWGQSSNQIKFEYNKNGDLKKHYKASSPVETTHLYDYDVFGNLRSVTLPNDPTDDVISYEVDGLNRRIVRRKNGNFTSRYLYEDQLRVAAELDESGNIVKRFIYGDSPNVPDYMEYDGDRYILLKDPRGSVLQVRNSKTGELMQRLEYTDWGRVINDTSPGFQPFGFAGGLYDPETRLVRFGSRDYDPEIGRWLSKDPIRFEGNDTNLYNYVLNEPINNLDPEGLRTGVITDRTYGGGASVGGSTSAGTVGITIGICLASGKKEKESKSEICRKAWEARMAGCNRGPAENRGKCYSDAASEYNRCVRAG